jgi:hypothetical protein
LWGRATGIEKKRYRADFLFSDLALELANYVIVPTQDITLIDLDFGAWIASGVQGHIWTIKSIFQLS